MDPGDKDIITGLLPVHKKDALELEKEQRRAMQLVRDMENLKRMNSRIKSLDKRNLMNGEDESEQYCEQKFNVWSPQKTRGSPSAGGKSLNHRAYTFSVLCC